VSNNASRDTSSRGLNGLLLALGLTVVISG
jgi:hypothetical protein